MDSLIKTEICDINRILEGIDGVRSEEEFQAAREKLVTAGEMKSRGDALQEKTERSMPCHDQYSAEPWKAEVFVGSNWVEVTIALNVGVTGQSIPKDATQIAGSYQVRDVQFRCSQHYQVKFPDATGERTNEDDHSSNKTGDTSRRSFNFKPSNRSGGPSDRSDGQSFSSYGGLSGVPASRTMSTSRR